MRPLIRALLLIACQYTTCAHAQQAYAVLRDLVYNTVSNQKLDLYVPAPPVKRAALLFVHGGGFREGSKEQLASLCALYARAGFVAASIDYRLAPAHPFPAALQGTSSAIVWLWGQAAARGSIQASSSSLAIRQEPIWP